MNTASHSSVAAEINRLHAEAQRQTAASRAALQAAMTAAWEAGRLLIEEKKRVRRQMGGGAWTHWLEQYFQGTLRTAQKYMRLACEVAAPSFLQGMSLRQIYLSLGIATEPKSRSCSPVVPAMPPHIRLAHKLLLALKKQAKVRRHSHADHSETDRRDLRALYEHLRRVFGDPPSTNFLNECLSKERTHEDVAHPQR